MNPNKPTSTNLLKVGAFTLLGLLLIGMVTVLVNHKPYWWRSCQLVKINIDDATGLKTKSPIRSLGLEIGYLKTVELSETHVTLGICITAPVEVLPSTRAYIRGEGFLGDKFVELKPVRYTGPRAPDQTSSGAFFNLISEARADEEAHAADVPPGGAPPKRTGHEREIPVGEESQDVQQLVNRVDQLVGQMTELTTNIKQGINPDELRNTMRQLNRTLENASKTLSPEGGLNQTAQRTLAKLEDAVEQLRDMMVRMNKGEGSVGMLLNDPYYAEQIKQALKSLNKLLSKAADFRFAVDVGAMEIPNLSGSRSWFQLSIWPSKDRYYQLGVTSDPRGKLTVTNYSTTVGGQTVLSQTNQTEQTGIEITAMLGKVFLRRLDISVGSLYGDGTAEVKLNLGPHDNEEMLQLRNDVYSHGLGFPIDDRAGLWVHPVHYFPTVYVAGGMESFRQTTISWYYGGGLTFDDDDIKLLFALK